MEKHKEMLLDALTQFHKKLSKEPKVVAIIQKERELDLLSEKIKLIESLIEA